MPTLRRSFPVPGVARAAAWSALLIGALFLLAPGAAPRTAAATSPQDTSVLVTTVRGPITPVIADHVADGVRRAEQGGHAAYLIRLDTPGGLDSSMRSIVQTVLGAEVPVLVHIAPSGARGASAGAVIAFAGHVAAMAPGTSIGAATPISSGGDDLDAKVVNDAVAYVESLAELRGRDVDFARDSVRDGRSAGAAEALAIGAVDLVATTTEDVLAQADGRTVLVGDGERPTVLRIAGAALVEHDMGLLRTIQQFLADPNVAFLLMSIGTLGLIYELASPGIGVGAVLGLTFVVLGLFGLAVLPVNVVGIVFLLLAAALFAVEVAAPGIGLAAGGGVLASALAGTFLVDDVPGLEVSLVAVVPTAIVIGAFVVLAGRFAARARRLPSTTTGPGVLIGRSATVHRRGGATQAFVGGAWWRVRAAPGAPEPTDGSLVEVVAVDGLDVIVRPVTTSHRHLATGDIPL